MIIVVKEKRPLKFNYINGLFYNWFFREICLHIHIITGISTGFIILSFKK